jgi:hypothetical protein
MSKTRFRAFLRRRMRGQAMAETALLTTLLIGVGGALVHFYPDSLNALQIYMDSFYFVLSLPIP